MLKVKKTISALILNAKPKKPLDSDDRKSIGRAEPGPFQMTLRSEEGYQTEMAMIKKIIRAQPHNGCLCNDPSEGKEGLEGF